MESYGKMGSGGEADDARLRYHLNALYAPQPVPDDLLRLIRELDTHGCAADCADD